MSFLEKFFAGAFGLILVYLLVKNWQGVNGILSGFANFNAKTFSVLQGNNTGLNTNF
jgi:hypothetical protein